jgi:hypothetical protein
LYEEFIAGRAAVGKKVGLGLNTHMEATSIIGQEANVANNGGSRGERLQIMLTGDELTVLDEAVPQRSASC